MLWMNLRTKVNVAIEFHKLTIVLSALLAEDVNEFALITFVVGFAFTTIAHVCDL